MKAGSVLVIGAGGLGSPVVLYLAAAGVGRIGLVDCDNVDVSNLQRQILHTVDSVGTSKLKSAESRVKQLNPHIQMELHDEKLSAENARRIFELYDVIVDGTDNFSTRYLVNYACVLMRKPNAYGSIYRFEGQASVFHALEGPGQAADPPPPLSDTLKQDPYDSPVKLNVQITNVPEVPQPVENIDDLKALSGGIGLPADLQARQCQTNRHCGVCAYAYWNACRPFRIESAVL